MVARHGMFVERMNAYLDHHEKERQNAPLLVFIDPFGFSGISITTIARILDQNHSEVLINFDVDGIIRNLENTDAQDAIKELFGEKVSLETGNLNQSKHIILRDLYQNKLLKFVPYVRHFEMAKGIGDPSYYLFFATKSLKGFEKMKDAMWKIDPLNGYRFVDKTDKNQEVMFSEDSVELVLVPQLIEHLKTQPDGVTNKNIEDYVLEKTIFRIPHKTKALKQLEDNGRITVNGRESKRSGVYKNTYIRLVST